MALVPPDCVKAPAPEKPTNSPLGAGPVPVTLNSPVPLRLYVPVEPEL